MTSSQRTQPAQRATQRARPARPGRRAQVLRALKSAEEPLSIAGIAEQLGVHPNTVRFHLEALSRTGQVEQVVGKPTGPGRPAALFRAVPGMDPSGPTQYRVLARILAQDIAAGPDPRARAIAAGRRWGAAHAEELGGPVTSDEETVVGAPPGTERLMHLMEEMDFDPGLQPGQPGSVGLRHCPFLDLVAEFPTVVCSLHLGLMQGAMGEWRSGTEVTDLVPFAQPDLCVAHLRPLAPDPSSD